MSDTKEWATVERRLPIDEREWLVTDGRGGFAMGTVRGTRTRKYHGFYLGIAGRAERAFLSDLELEWNGRRLWPHFYAAATKGEGAVIDPVPETEPVFGDAPWPQWTWSDPGTRQALSLTVRPDRGRGIRLAWRGAGRLRVRPFLGFRNLHGLGGAEWTLAIDESVAEARAAGGESFFLGLDGTWSYRAEPSWYRRFHYPLEAERGYDSVEDLFSAGWLEIDLPEGGASASWLLGPSRESIAQASLAGPAKEESLDPVLPALDFVVRKPAGIVAGYPWFGEWGRDTFIALPGIVSAWISAPEADDLSKGAAGAWAREVLDRWAGWIVRDGMVPNLIDSGGQPQWDSADGTLWWCHALAGLAALGEKVPALAGILEEFRRPLQSALGAISEGRHRHLSRESDGLLRVEGEGMTWMDARIGGRAVTPRFGRLPEINALWVQAWALEAQFDPGRWPQVKALARRSLELEYESEESSRPNLIFLHSLPWAPSFILKDKARLRHDLLALERGLLTPVGLRTLAPDHPGFRAHCAGTQDERDRAYHQGTIWPWLTGHRGMAADRLATRARSAGEPIPEPALFERPLIAGHVPEILDAAPPYLPRGCPAQAWSLACTEEWKARRRLGLDRLLQGRLPKAAPARKADGKNKESR